MAKKSKRRGWPKEPLTKTGPDSKKPATPNIEQRTAVTGQGSGAVSRSQTADSRSLKKSKRFLFRVCSILIGLVVALVAAEVLLRMTGHTPWITAAADPNEIALQKPDPELGWVNRSGKFTRPSYSPPGPVVEFTFLEDGSRATSREEISSQFELILLGGSYTQGQAITDEETYAWKLQEHIPHVKVGNYGVAGYGTYQSLLTLERIVAREVKPVMVIYGFIEDHENRNVATADWLRVLAEHSQRGHVDVPYCTLDEDGRLVRHAPEQYPAWPLCSRLATVATLQRSYVDLVSRGRLNQRQHVTEQLMFEMKRTAEASGADFTVAMLSTSEQTGRRYLNFFIRNNFNVCTCGAPLTEDLKVPGEGHPNEKMHTLWAERMAFQIAIPLEELLPPRARDEG